MFKKILVCLDGSSLAKEIMPYATEQAIGFKSKVILLQVVPIPGIPVPGIPGAAGAPVHTQAMLKQWQRDENKAKAYLENAAQPLREKGLHVACVTLQGSPGPAIISYANENKVDLITIATHGHSGLRNVVFGSTAESLLRESGLPVLIIRPEHTKT